MFPSLKTFWTADHRSRNRLRRTSNDVIRSVAQTDYSNPPQLPTGRARGIAIVWPDKATADDRWGINSLCGRILRGRFGYFTQVSLCCFGPVGVPH
jgi:hypothetical protein